MEEVEMVEFWEIREEVVDFVGDGDGQTSIEAW